MGQLFHNLAFYCYFKQIKEKEKKIKKRDHV